MKKLLLSIFIFGTIYLVNAQQGSFQPTHQKNLGLVAYLVHVKMVSENIILPLIVRLDSLNIADSAKVSGLKLIIAGKRDTINSKISDYISLKITYDEITLQLMADLKMRNKIRLYRRINRKIRNHTESAFFKTDYPWRRQLNRYRKAYSDGDSLFRQFIFKKKKKETDTTIYTITSLVFPTLGQSSPTDIAGFVWGMIKDNHDMNKDKVDGICDLLDSIRLSDVSDLGSDVKTGGSGGDSKSGSKKAKAKN